MPTRRTPPCSLVGQITHSAANSRCLAIGLLLALAAAVAGCQQRRSDDTTGTQEPQTTEYGAGTVLFSPTTTGLDGFNKVEHAFDISNAYDRPLKLTLAGVSCGCTVASLDREIIQPHETAHLQMSVILANKNEDRSVEATVKTDDGREKRFVLRWQTRARITSANGGAVLVRVSPTRPAKKDLSFLCSQPLEEPAATLFVRSDDDRLKVHIVGVAEQPSESGLRKWKVDAELLASASEPGSLRKNVTWIEAGYDDHLYQQPVWLQSHDQIRVTPSQVFLKGGHRTTSTELRLTSDKEFRILGVRADSESIVLDCQFDKSAQSSHVIRASIKFSEERTGLFESGVLIETDHPEQPLLHIPISALGPTSSS